jgi:hypothetical protein
MVLLAPRRYPGPDRKYDTCYEDRVPVPFAGHARISAATVITCSMCVRSIP